MGNNIRMLGNHQMFEDFIFLCLEHYFYDNGLTNSPIY